MADRIWIRKNGSHRVGYFIGYIGEESQAGNFGVSGIQDMVKEKRKKEVGCHLKHAERRHIHMQFICTSFFSYQLISSSSRGPKTKYVLSCIYQEYPSWGRKHTVSTYASHDLTHHRRIHDNNNYLEKWKSWRALDEINHDRDVGDGRIFARACSRSSSLFAFPSGSKPL